METSLAPLLLLVVLADEVGASGNDDTTTTDATATIHQEIVAYCFILSIVANGRLLILFYG